jgi:uncharacterized protein (DUF1800 family)
MWLAQKFINMRNFIFIIASICVVIVNAQIHSDYVGAGNFRNITITSSSNAYGSSPYATVNGRGLDYKIFDASRFLAQSTFGVKRSYIDTVAKMGYEAWINDQFTKTPSLIVPKINLLWDSLYILYRADKIAKMEDTADIFGPYAVHFNYALWDNNMKNQDLLRQRVAEALSEILVVSMRSQLTDWARCLGSYYDILVGDAFSTYGAILKKVTYHPAMGFYLSHFNNPKTDTVKNTRPDENYAREVMQLFTIGLFELNNDGTYKLNAQGQKIPTYDNEDIAEMAKIFTGLGPGEKEPWVWWSAQAYFGLDIYSSKKDIPMKMYPPYHESGVKKLLKTGTTNASNTPDQDIDQAINFLVNHPNTGPFLARLLIQRLVKSNPSPGYISRVATAYNTPNAQGQKGDMKNIIKAILLDPEARTVTPAQLAATGMMRPPFIRAIHYARSLDMNSPKNRFYNNSFNILDNLGQTVLASPSVFNFYPPDHRPIGDINNAGLVAPEFKLHNSSKAITFINEAHAWTIWGSVMYDWEDDLIFNNPTITHNIDRWIALAPNTEKMINELDKILTHGQLSDQSKSYIRKAVNDIKQSYFGNDYTLWRARMAIYLIYISADYSIIK